MEPAPAERAPARRWLRGCAVGLGAALLLGALLAGPLARALPGMLIERDVPGPADALVVLAGDSSGGRVDAAAALFAAGHLPQGPVLLSGGRLYAETSWASAMRARAIAQGIPAERLVLQERSTTTVEDARFSLPLLRERGVARVLLVTSAWHSGRAARIFRREAGEGLEIVSCPAPDPPREWWRDADATRALAMEVLKWAWPGPGG